MTYKIVYNTIAVEVIFNLRGEVFMKEFLDIIEICINIYEHRKFFICILITCLVFVVIPSKIRSKKSEEKIDFINEIVYDRDVIKIDIDEGKEGKELATMDMYDQMNNASLSELSSMYLDVSTYFIETLYDDLKGKRIKYIYNGFDNDYHYYTLRSLFKEDKYIIETIKHYKNRLGIDELYTKADYAISLKKNNGNLKLVNRKEVEPSKREQKKLKEHYYRYEYMYHD